jgi:hypothetical protein
MYCNGADSRTMQEFRKMANNKATVNTNPSGQDELTRLYEQFRAEVKEVDFFFYVHYAHLLRARKRLAEAGDSRISEQQSRLPLAAS